MFNTKFKPVLCSLGLILGFSALLPTPAAQASPTIAPVATVQAQEAHDAFVTSKAVNKHKGADSAKKNGTTKRAAPLSRRAFNAALTRAGSSYGYGGVGPSVFDCSGLTRWAYAQAGKSLPHSSDAQVGSVVRTSRPQLGDLVFFHSGGNVYHVGLWAGPGQVFHASKPGVPVGRARIWTSSVFFGHVR